MKEQKAASHFSITLFTLIFSLVFIAFSCQQTDHETVADQNEALVMQYIEAYNQRDLSGMQKILTDPFLLGGEEIELNAFIDLVEGYWSTFPDIYLDATHVVGAENHTTVRILLSGTGEGELFGHDIDGKEVNVSEVILFGVSNGQIAEYWYAWDELGFLTQLGLIDSPYPGSE